ncbi:MAG: relaxase/mobilization nuclease domain-containing protein [Clostridia bacterium]|nr:relaxase/mobilization nuclease domain-containing protein [Clostridia bacterium]
MATTRIHSITSTPKAALDYVVADKVEMFDSEDMLNKNVLYVLEGEHVVRYPTLSSFVFNLSGASFYSGNVDREPYKVYQSLEAFAKEKGKYHQDAFDTKSGREVSMWHLHQSFNGNEVAPHVAHEIGIKLAEKLFAGHAVTVSTHTNTNNVHNHFIISAWNDKGLKWNNSNNNYRLIRNTSDRLCEEYGLHVLDSTKEYRLNMYVDKQGVSRAFEPTSRKIDIITERDVGVSLPDDVSGYRQTDAYVDAVVKKESVSETIKKDIDAALPSCASYDDLLHRLREMGYSIRDKKKSGEWREHISYQPPSALKGTRENKIGDGYYYTRENLTSVIEGASREAPSVSIVSDVPYVEEYVYPACMTRALNDDYKAVIDSASSSISVVPRSSFEKEIVTHIRKDDNYLRRISDSISNVSASKSKPAVSASSPLRDHSSRKDRLIEDIQNGLRSLRYIETHNVSGIGHMVVIYSAAKENHRKALVEFSSAEKALSQVARLVSVPDDARRLANSIQSNKDDVSYQIENLSGDSELLQEYNTLIARHKLDDPSVMSELRLKHDEFSARRDDIRSLIRKASNDVLEVEICLHTFERIYGKEYVRDVVSASRQTDEAQRDDKERGDKNRSR